jgi:hypothetical protein
VRNLSHLEWQTHTLELWFPKKWGATNSKKDPYIAHNICSPKKGDPKEYGFIV